MPTASAPNTIEPASGGSSASTARIAIVVSRYNRWITDRLLEGAIKEFGRRGGKEDALAVLPAPGSFELPMLARVAATSGRFDAVVCLGCVIRGETTHDQHIASAVSQGIMQVATQTGVPVTFGVLTVENADQAEARAGGAQGNKGAEAMAAALDVVAVSQALHRDPASR